MARLLAWAAVAVALAGLTANVLRLRSDVSFAGPLVAAQVLELAAGAALIVAGGLAVRGRNRWLLAAAGAGWLMAEWASPAAPGAAALTAGLISLQASVPLVLASRWRRDGGSPPRTVLLSVALALALGGATLTGPLAAVAASPRDAGCTDCASDLIGLDHDVTLSTLLTRLGGQLIVASGLIAVCWLTVGIVAARRPATSASPGSFAADIAAALFAAAVAAAAAVVLLSGSAGSVAYLCRAGADATLLVLAGAVAVPAFRASRARRAVARAAVAVADDPDHSAADALAGALDDGALRIAYPAPGGAWRDRRGQLIILPNANVTFISDAGENVAALIHGSLARVDRASVAGAVAAARLLLDAERLEAGALARVNDLRAARKLVVEAADAARAALERDLHDGAQQRLVALRYALGLASARAARRSGNGLAATLADADAAAEQALTQLRELTHGISPATLAAEGLAEAVRSAAEVASSPVTIVELPSGRLTERIEQTVYRFVADSLRHADGLAGSGLSVAVRHTGPDVIIEVSYDRAVNCADWPPAHLADRVAAVGGQLQAAGRTGLIAVLPCE